MSIKMRLPVGLSGLSVLGQELKVKVSKGIRYVELETEQVEAAISHGLTDFATDVEKALGFSVDAQAAASTASDLATTAAAVADNAAASIADPVAADPLPAVDAPVVI